MIGCSINENYGTDLDKLEEGDKVILNSDCLTQY